MANRLDKMIDDLSELKDMKVNKSNVGSFVWSIEDLTRRYFPDRDPLRKAVCVFGGAISVNEPESDEYYVSLSSRYKGKSKALAADVRLAKEVIRKEIKVLKHIRKTPQ